MRVLPCLTVFAVSFAAHLSLPYTVDNQTAGPSHPTPGVRAAAVTRCTDAVVVAVPGASDTTGATAGPVLAPAIARVRAAAGDSGRTVSQVVVAASVPRLATLRGSRSPDLPVSKAVRTASWRKWNAPTDALRQKVAARATTALAACPEQMLYLVGFGHGAAAVHTLLATAPQGSAVLERLAGVLLVSDPLRVEGEFGVRFPGRPAVRTGKGVSRARSDVALPRLSEMTAPAPIFGVCVAVDVVCDFGRSTFRAAARAHRSYATGTIAGVVRSVGSNLGRRLAWRALAPSSEQLVLAQQHRPVFRALPVRVEPSRRARVVWTATSALPEGLELSTDGVLRGTATRVGRFEVTYRVSDPTAGTFSLPSAGRLAVDVTAVTSETVSAGGAHTCTIRADRSLWCWGSNDYGQLGVGDRIVRKKPTRVGTATSWRSVSTGGGHTCAVRVSGALYCWGLNHRGQLGTGTRSSLTSPRLIEGVPNWASVSTGWSHTCGIRTGGAALCWGFNRWGELGLGDRTARLRPQAIPFTWRSLSLGGWSTCGVRSDGALACWGRNDSGELGLGDRIDRTSPARLGTGASWVEAAVGWTHACALNDAGTAWCWGDNNEGQLGVGDREPRLRPTMIDGLRLGDLDTGANFSCGVSDSAELWCWGGNRTGQLAGPAGVGSVSPRHAADAPEEYTRLTLGWSHACAVSQARTLSCWGAGDAGQMGNGDSADRDGVGPKVSVGVVA